jgi:hypothetical protein
MKIKIRKTDRGREGEAVSLCPRDFNPTVGQVQPSANTRLHAGNPKKPTQDG